MYIDLKSKYSAVSSQPATRISIHLVLYSLYYRRQTKITKVMFSQVSVCPGGSGPFHAGIHTPRADTPTRADPQGRPPHWEDPLWAHTPLRSACWDTVNKHVVRIPLECILVVHLFCLSQFNEISCPIR